MNPPRPAAPAWAAAGLALALCLAGAGARATELGVPEQERVVTFLGHWLAAWEAQDLPVYLSTYAADARVDSRDRAAFDEHKRRVFARADAPRIRIGDLDLAALDQGGERLVRARFLQDYDSAAVKDFGRKELLLRRVGSAFLIVRETWTPATGSITVPFDPRAGLRVADAPSVTRPQDGEAPEPLLGEGYAPPLAPPAGAVEGEPPTGIAEPDAALDAPLLTPPPPTLALPGLPSEALEGDKRVVEEIVARVNGRVLTRTMLVDRIGWYQETLLAENPPDLEARIQTLAAETLDTTIDRWVLLQEALSRNADVEGFWREWLVGFRRQVGADDIAEVEDLLREQGTSLDRLKEQVIETEIPNMYLQQEIAGRLTFPETELREHFEANRARYQPPITVTFRQILVAPGEGGESRAEALARHVVEELAAGRDWCEVNASYGQASAACRDLVDIALTDLLPELREVAQGLPLNAVSRPIRSPQGFHILRVSARQGADPVLFEDVREIVLRDIRASVFDAELQRVLEGLRGSAEIDITRRYATLATAADVQ